MKISVIITTILVAQVSASFFDVFHGAVLSVQNSFGKLLSDVVTDVKETVDCTILAVEHVLSLSHDATTRYYDKCSSGTKKTDSVSEAPQYAIMPKMEVTLNLPNNNDEYLQKVIPSEIDARINERLSKVLGNYKPHDNVLSIQNVLAKESEQLAGVSVLVKKELEKLSNEVTTDLKNIEKQRVAQPSVDTILQEIKVLEQREQNAKNTSEANEIHQVLGKLNVIEATETSENVKLEEILKDVETNSNNSFVSLRRQFEEWKEEEARYLSEIKSKIEEHEETSDYHHGSYKRNGSHLIQPVLLNTNINSDDIEAFSSSSGTSNKNITLVIEALDSSTSSRTYTDNDMSVIPVSNETSFPQNKTLLDSGLNDIVIASNSYSTTKSPIGSEIIHIFESPTAVESTESSTLSTNQSTTTPINFTGDDPKLTIATISISESTPVNGNVQPVDSIMDSDKKQKFIRNKTTSILSTDEINSTQSVIPIQTETSITEVISSSQNNYNSNASANSSTANPLFENTSLNATGSGNEASAILPSYELATAKVVSKFEDIQPTDTMITSISPSINDGTSLNDTILSIENTKTAGNVKTSTELTDNEYDTKTPSTSLLIVKNAPKSKTIQPIELATVTSKQEFTITIVHDNNSKDIIIPSTSSPTVENTFVRENIQPEETTTTSSNNSTISSISSPIVEYSTVNHTTEPVETSTSSYEESLNGSKESIIANALSIVKITPVSDTIEVNTKVSSYEESTEAVTEFITTSKIEHDSYTPLTSASIPNKSRFESETIEDIEVTTVFSREEESLDTTATESPNSENGGDDSSATIVKSQPISERTPEENFAESENDETLSSTTNSQIDSPAMLADTDSYTDTITSTTLNIDFDSTNIENEEPVILPKTHAAILNEVTNENTEINDTLLSFTETADSPVITETFKTVETTTASGEQDLSSTSTRSAINEIVAASTAFPSIESISERIISSRNEVDLRNELSLEANTFSRNPNIPDLNHMMKDTPFTITQSPLVNRELVTANKLNQQRYNTNAEPRNNYDLNAPISLRDPSLQTIQPFINPGVLNRRPIYDQPAMPPIPRGLFNEASKQADAFAYFDSIDKRLSQSDSPFGPDDDRSLTSLLANAPRKPIDSRTMFLKNPSFLPPLHPILPLSFDNSVPGNSYRPQGLTTHRPRNLNNYKNPSIDYDSFFHTPPRNSEAHQRAVKEAQQIIANSKQSDRFINEIMKNKNKFNARSIFNG